MLPAVPERKLGRVLVVDDVALNREILIMHLGDAIRHFDEAAEGLAALSLFKQSHYDAVLLDVEMPGLDGYGTMIELRRWEREHRIPPTPVVAITSSDFPEDKQRILAAGATAYLVKPLKRQALMASLQLHCIVDSGANPTAKMLPRFFASARVMLDEMVGLEDPESMSKTLHKMRGMIAVFGFVEFEARLKQIHFGVKQGKLPEPAVLQQLQKELQHMETIALKQP